MFTLTISRPDLTTDQVVAALRDGLGPEYNVLPGTCMSRNPFARPHQGPPDSILVGVGSNRLRRAQVTLDRYADQTQITTSYSIPCSSNAFCTRQHGPNFIPWSSGGA